MTSFFRMWRRSPRLAPSRERQSLRQRRTHIEGLEPRLVLSHNGEFDIVFAMPSAMAEQMSENMDVAAAATIFPGEEISYDTLPNGLPILDSFPAAPSAIYLDFTGGNYHGSESVPPYDTDGNPAVYGLSEQLAIYEAWRQVSVYFAMFNVTVTTVPTTKPKAWILPSDSGGSGVSYVNVFPNNRPESKAGTSTVVSRISVIPHELGHNFGLRHTSRYDSLGVKTAEYSGEFSPLHGPIMGIDYSGIIHKWSWWHNATSSGNRTLQDDIAVIAGRLNAYDGSSGDGYRPDDHGGTLASATALPYFGATQSIMGIVERMEDVDMFSFQSTGGRYSIVAGRDAPSGVDVKLSIYDAAGEMIAYEDGDPRAFPYTMVNDQQISLDLPAGTYYARIESHGNYGDLGQYILRVDPLPSGWIADDIGLVGVPGFSSYDESTGTMTVTGSGSDISSSSDSFHYLYQSLDGNGSITARIASMENTNSNAKVGIMIRDSLAANSRNAMMYVRPGNQTHFSFRTGTGGGTSTSNGPSGASWKWVRMIRVGNTITAQVSTNGVSWTTVGTQNVVMGSTVLIGLATTARNNVKINQATFTNVTVSGNVNPAPVLNDLAAPEQLQVTTVGSNQVELAWQPVPVPGDIDGDGVVNHIDVNMVKSNFGGVGAAGLEGDINSDGVVDLLDYNFVRNNMATAAPGYAIERSTDGVHFHQIGTTAPGVTTFISSALSSHQRYTYRVRAMTPDNAVSEASNTASALTLPGVVTSVTSMSISTSRIVIDWRDTSGESYYRVQRSDDGETNWINRGSLLAPNTPSYTDSLLPTGRTYYYRVLTLGPGGQVIATSPVIVESTRLRTVGGLSFTSVASNQISLQWNSVADATGYRVQRSTDGSTYGTVASNVSATNYTDNNILPGITYYYRVVGLKSNITESSSPSSVVSTTTPQPASGAPELLADGGESAGSAGGSGGTHKAAPAAPAAIPPRVLPTIAPPLPSFASAANPSKNADSSPSATRIPEATSASFVGPRRHWLDLTPLASQSWSQQPTVARKPQISTIIADSTSATRAARPVVDTVFANWGLVLDSQIERGDSLEAADQVAVDNLYGGVELSFT